MNKLTRTALLAGAAYASFRGASASAETAPQCAAVYQDFETASDPRLPITIEEMRSNYGTEVHVQVVDDGSRYGITAKGEAGARQAQRYLEDTAQKCGWDEDNLLTVLVSKSPRVYRVNAEGEAHKTFPDSRLKGDQEEQFIADLQDTETPLQADVNAYLKDIQDAEEGGGMSDAEVLLIVGLVGVVGGGALYLALRKGGGGGYGGFGSSSGYYSSSSSSSYTSFGSFGGFDGGGSGGTGGGY